MCTFFPSLFEYNVIPAITFGDGNAPSLIKRSCDCSLKDPVCLRLSHTRLGCTELFTWIYKKYSSEHRGMIHHAFERTKISLNIRNRMCKIFVWIYQVSVWIHESILSNTWRYFVECLKLTINYMKMLT